METLSSGVNSPPPFPYPLRGKVPMKLPEEAASSGSGMNFQLDDLDEA